MYSFVTHTKVNILEESVERKKIEVNFKLYRQHIRQTQYYQFKVEHTRAYKIMWQYPAELFKAILQNFKKNL